MKRTHLWGLLALGAGVVVILLWTNRSLLRERWEEARKPELPVAENFQPEATSTALQVATTTTKVTPPKKPAPLPVATSTKPTTQDPLAWSGPLPTSTNLAVPFLSQAPKMDWSAPYQEACEEAASIMVDAYYRGRTAKFQPEEGDKAILDLAAYTIKRYGGHEDTTAVETAQFIKDYFGYKTVLVRDVTGADDIKRALANRYPVIVPAYGKALGNPNFQNGGPLYHMLVIKGYLPDGRWITNDPGTRKGADYLYDKNTLINAIHDWNGGDVPHGKPLMIVVVPN